MKLDAALKYQDLSQVPALARAADELSFSALWASDTGHNPILPLVLAAEHTSRIRLGTAILVAFARSPMDVAYQAWDLARYSRGRFILGLGTQVAAHIRRRFSMEWKQPSAEALRDYVDALRAIWSAWQTGERLNYRGRFYSHTLMSPFFDPGPHDYPQIPIFTAGVNPLMCRLAGEICDGLHAHPFHTQRYLQEVVKPAVAEGMVAAGRSPEQVEISSAIMVATGDSQVEIDAAREELRRQVAFYASTPSYDTVMDLHGWGEAREQLSQLAGRQRWTEMPALVNDEMLDAFVLTAPWDELGGRIHARYDGLLDRVTLYAPFDPDKPAGWQKLATSF